MVAIKRVRLFEEGQESSGCIKDMLRAIHSTIEEIGFTGKLNVLLDSDQAVASIGQPGGDDVEDFVEVHVLKAA